MQDLPQKEGSISVLIVAQSKIADKKTGKPRLLKYSDVPTDEHNWVLDLEYMPIPYDILFLKIKDHPKPKSGWWTGITWKGLMVKKEDEVLAWKRNQNFG